MLISAIHQHKSAISIHGSPSWWTSLPLPTAIPPIWLVIEHWLWVACVKQQIPFGDGEGQGCLVYCMQSTGSQRVRHNERPNNKKSILHMVMHMFHRYSLNSPSCLNTQISSTSNLWRTAPSNSLAKKLVPDLKTRVCFACPLAAKIRQLYAATDWKLMSASAMGRKMISERKQQRAD